MPLDGTKTHYFEDLHLGMEASLVNRVTQSDIVQFAELTGNQNPVHLDALFAAQTIFKRRIAHEMLTAGFISAVFGMELPGPGAIYISQTLNFRRAVRDGDEVVSHVEVIELIQEKSCARFECACSVQGVVVLEGEAVLMVLTRPR